MEDLEDLIIRHEQIEESGLRIARWGYAEAVDGGAAMVKRIQLAIDSQARARFTWPTGVHVDVPVLPGAALPDRVVAEVRRLQGLGFPIRITDEARAA